jgi:hypothetical protein
LRLSNGCSDSSIRRIAGGDFRDVRDGRVSNVHDVETRKKTTPMRSEIWALQTDQVRVIVDYDLVKVVMTSLNSTCRQNK